MAENNWGNCKNCKHFGSHARQPDAAEAAACHQPELRKFELRVFGASGCNAFELRAGAVDEDYAQQPL